jgi:hypothetical protein
MANIVDFLGNPQLADVSLLGGDRIDSAFEAGANRSHCFRTHRYPSMTLQKHDGRKGLTGGKALFQRARYWVNTAANFSPQLTKRQKRVMSPR